MRSWQLAHLKLLSLDAMLDLETLMISRTGQTPRSYVLGAAWAGEWSKHDEQRRFLVHGVAEASGQLELPAGPSGCLWVLQEPPRY